MRMKIKNYFIKNFTKIIIPILALILGLCTYFIPWSPHTSWASYLSLAVLAAMDSVIGGIKAYLEGKFKDDLFITSFIFNTLIAAFLAFLGDKIGLNLFLAALIALGSRIFINISIIRNDIMKILKNTHKK